MLSRRMRLCFLILLAAGFGTMLEAQNTSGTITGTVVDTTGSVIDQASARIENVDTHVSRSAVTDASGNYTATLLPPRPLFCHGEQAGIQGQHIGGPGSGRRPGPPSQRNLIARGCH